MRAHAAQRNLDLWYLRIGIEDVLGGASASATKAQLKRAEKVVAKARAKDSVRAFGKLTESVDGEVRIRSDPPVVVPIHDLFDAKQHALLDERLRGVIRDYRATLPDDRRRLMERFRYVDAARKVVGVGSVGTRAWIVLFVGRDNADPLFLQIQGSRGVGARALSRRQRVRAATASASSRVSASPRAPATSCSAGLRPTTSTASGATTTCASSGT